MTELVPGVYEDLVTEGLQEQLQTIDGKLVYRQDLDEAEVSELLVKHLATLTRRALRIAGERSKESVAAQVATANRIADAISILVAEAADRSDQIADSHDLLLEISTNIQPDEHVTRFQRPDIPLSSSALLVNGRDQPKIGPEVIKELDSADEVDLICAFVKWHGIRLIEDALRDFVGRGGKLRVITTTYMGATDQAAVDRLVELGAEVKVSYDTRRTRLHAKAWLFHRKSKLDTAYIGSSNLSRSAMLDGLEWNVRLARAEQESIIKTFAATFEEYWSDPTFEEYDPKRDRGRLKEALASSGKISQANSLTIANIDVRPYGYQQEILDALEAARVEHDHRRNLAVMATGTGKTIVSALDYKRLREAGEVESLLFVAHTKEILEQSLHTFRTVLKDGSFGELFVDGQNPTEWKHVFGSIQSLRNLSNLPKDKFQMVIVDEFHHAAAKSYSNLLEHLDPHILLGLTATPERTDGEDILHWFDGRKPTVELRLWEALEQGILVPFHYFGIHDNVDLSHVTWKRGLGYDVSELTELYTNLDSRVNIIAQSIENKIADVSLMKAVGFCVSIKHAEYMATQFNEREIPSRAITSAMSSEQRKNALIELKNGELKAVFAVDIFNEGVDVPAINTVLFLRPTNSATIFLQQLGRGLRITQDKPVLTVLDFVGHQRKEFRFDKQLSALTGITRGNLEDAITEGFPVLPAGCAIDLDREVSKAVLNNIKQALGFRAAEVVTELKTIGGDPTLAEFLQKTGRELEDLYSGNRGGWTRIRRQAGLDNRPIHDLTSDEALGRAFGRILHLDDRERLNFLQQ
ncbi:DEAD/DEAH box helicase family protein, partial [Actinocorallia aurantiaca]|uniref:DEAD/DEAH box helicase family protein n=1 Tax=Actinocorallia aurantiaca TaxID=46204 RepID=UPI0031D01CFD